MGDNINHPTHYEQSHPGIECIDLTDGFSFSLGQVALTLAQRHMLERLGGESDGCEAGFWGALLAGDLVACRRSLCGLIETVKRLEVSLE